MTKTPLYPIYARYGAKTVPFHGWEMPLMFSSIQNEHTAVRTRAGLFDVSHMGELIVSGSDALAWLQSLTTNDLSKIGDGQVQYTFMCQEDGGTVDDLLVYRFAHDRYMLVVNAGNLEKDWNWLKRNQTGDVRLENVSEETALLALQGPESTQILSGLTDLDLHTLAPFRFVPEVRVGECQVLLSRTGYTGEDGFELYVAAQDAISLWETLMERGKRHGLVPAGLGARDTLRLEAGMPLYGQELGPDVTPIEAGFGFAVRPEKGEFIGRKVLAEQKRSGPGRKTVGLEMIERGIARSGYDVVDGERKIGVITSGTHSLTLKKNIALARIEADYALLGTELTVDVRGKRLKAKVIPTPFYKRKS
jgi:aminomethyltransferase